MAWNIRRFPLSLLFLTFALPLPTPAAFITIGDDVDLEASPVSAFRQHLRAEGVQLIEVDDRQLPLLGSYIHEQFHRCGGYFYHDSYEDALETLHKTRRGRESTFSLADYSIDQDHLVAPLLEQVDEFQIRTVITELSSFENRTYDTPTGVAAAKWLADYWRKLSNHRSDVSVELFEHKSWPQPSVVATMAGQSDEAIIIGGHLDSIAWLFSGLLKGKSAPGADDNASGIATITEALRILIQNNYAPQKTLIFMGYAAEEVGLRGSKEIAQTYRRKGVDVLGVMQLDMTNYHGSDAVINLVNDYTNKKQNTFLGQLIEHYLDVTWGYTKCGYACSDHASWTAEGFVASMPFEATKQEMNKKFHTKHDTLDVSGGHAKHATHFAKLALAYLVELDR